MKVALAAGHHNYDGGSPVEAAITGELCEAYARAFKAAGVDVRVITPDGADSDSEAGDGMFPGGLDAVAQKVVTWSEQGWTADLFLECHTQGVADSSVRGVFAIYPDWGSDLDSTVKGSLGSKIANAIHFASGIPVWNNGLMSEKSTGVGLSGYRLGIFRVTAAVASKTTRLIVEHGAHSNPQDLAILRGVGMLDKIAVAAVKAVTDFFGVTKDVNNDVIFIPETGKALGFGFKKFWEGLDAAGVNMRLKLMGYPVTNEFDMSFTDNPDSKRTVQLFERGGLVHENDQPQDWQNHTLKLAQLFEAYKFAADSGLLKVGQ
jgi:N-acetylmuramoyl-L-alanine amidase